MKQIYFQALLNQQDDLRFAHARESVYSLFWSGCTIYGWWLP